MKIKVNKRTDVQYFYPGDRRPYNFSPNFDYSQDYKDRLRKARLLNQGASLLICPPPQR